MVTRKWFAILLSMVLISACSPSATPTVTHNIVEMTIPPRSDLVVTSIPFTLSTAMLKNSTYQVNMPDTIEVKLSDGKFTAIDSAGKATVGNHVLNGRLVEPVAFGDLDGDGVRDAVVIIAVNYGGSGTFHEMIAVLARDEAGVQVANHILGDRIQEKQLTIQEGKVILDYLRQGPKDGMCCPSEHAQTIFQLQARDFVVLDDRVIP